MSLKKKAAILVAGAGIAGCAAAQELQSQGLDYLLLEKNVEPGGLTRSISIGEAHFDYTGHFMHLAQCKSPAAIPYANQSDRNWQLINRKSRAYVHGAFIPAPFQYNLYYLPKAAREQCITSFHNRPKIEKCQSFKEYLLTGFGQAICDYFLFPYNEKLMVCSLDDLSVDSVKRFFPLPERQKIENGYAQEGANLKTGYNSSFWYPKRYGIGLLSKGLSKGLAALQTCCQIEKVDLAQKCVFTPLGKIGYEKMLTSLPLKEFCTLCSDSSLHTLASDLKHTRVFCLNILIRGTAPKSFGDTHWIYIPEKAIPFYRLGIYSHISAKMNPSGHTALYVEAAFPDKATPPAMGDLIKEIFLSLERLGWAKRANVRVMSANWIDYAYVYFDQPRQGAVNKISDILHKYNVYPIGRYGLWDYISMEDTILSSIETARKVTGMSSNDDKTELFT